MFVAEGTLFLYTVEPIHVGAATGAGGIDLPQARDVWYGDPILPFSALRGMFFDVCPPGLRRVLLGVAPSARDRGSRGALSFSDAHPLLFPVRSSKGGFAWVTCPRLLDRFGRAFGWKCPITPEAGTAVIPLESVLCLEDPAGGRFVVLAGVRQTAREDEGIGTWLAERLGRLLPEPDVLGRRLAVVPDAECQRLLSACTERRQRVRIEGGTVAAKALWSIEAIPRDTVFFAPVLAASPRLWEEVVEGVSTAAEALEKARTILGGSAEAEGRPWVEVGGEITVGMGLCLARLI